MAIETRYVCDKCGAISDNKDTMWRVGIVVCDIACKYFNHSHVHNKALWCRTCLLQTGLIVPKTEEEKAAEQVKPLTLEDLVREIIREETENGP